MWSDSEPQSTVENTCGFPLTGVQFVQDPLVLWFFIINVIES